MTPRLLLGRFWCWATKHKRGVRVVEPYSLQRHPLYRCPRCGATWSRKARKAKVK